MENLFLTQVVRELSAGRPQGVLGLRVDGVSGAAPLTVLVRLAAREERMPPVSEGERARPEITRPEVSRPEVVLAVCLDSALPCLTTLEGSLPDAPAAENPDGFMRALSERLKGAVVARVEQLGRDRVARVVFTRGPDNSELVMWLELFGRRPAAVLTEAETGGILASSHEGVRSASGGILHAGAIYRPPAEKNKTAVEAVSVESLRQWTEEKSEEELSLRLSRRIEGLSPNAAFETLDRVGEQGAQALLEELRRQLTHPEQHFVPAVRATAAPEPGPEGRANPGRFDLALFPLGGAAFVRDPRYSVERFDTALEAVRHCLIQLCIWYRRAAARRLKSDANAVRTRLDKLRAALGEDMTAAERGDRFTRAGELILTHLKDIPRGTESVELRDVHGEGTDTVEVRLDPALSPSENADRCFKRARKAKRAREVLEKRIGDVEHRLRAIEKFVSEVPDDMGPGDLARLKHRLEKLTGTVRRTPLAAYGGPSVGRGERRSGAPVRPAASSGSQRPRGPKAAGTRQFNPRVFTTSEGYTVIVGRNNSENDYVTHHLARPEDLWFHAYGVTGSHVILRHRGKDAPSRRAVEEAASIAAYFSKAKTSSSVPVVYTQKKFVNKPRGGRPGTAVCGREKTVMAKPVRPVPRETE